MTTTTREVFHWLRSGRRAHCSAGGFDPARDIEAIAVNRWPHGYAFEPSPLFDPDYGPGEAPYETGRRRFGRVAVANSDAGASAYLNVAIDQALARRQRALRLTRGKNSNSRPSGS